MQPHDGLRAIRLGHMPDVDPDKLRRAAADVDHQQVFRLLADEWRAGDDREPRLFLRLDDIQAQSGLTLYPLHEIGAVQGTAAGFGGDQPHASDLVAPQFLLTDAQCLYLSLIHI